MITFRDGSDGSSCFNQFLSGMLGERVVLFLWWVFKIRKYIEMVFQQLWVLPIGIHKLNMPLMEFILNKCGLMIFEDL